jgi:hypothetical protein
MAEYNEFEDRVKDTTTTTGTGDITLSGSAPTGYRTFASVFTVGQRVCYAISSSGGSEWEVGRGTLTGATTLARTQVRRSSNSDALVNFSAGTKDVFCTIDGVFISRVPTHGKSIAITAGVILP